MGAIRNPRRLQRLGIYVIFPLALLCFLLVIGAHYAHNDYDVWLADFFLFFPLGAWRIFGIAVIVVFLAAELLIFLYPAMLIRVRGLSPDLLGPQLHVRCRTCGVVHWVQDTGARPLYHTCPHCGTEGQYGDAEHGQKDFIYTQVELKLGCTNCDTTFLVPEPLVRPLYTKCPTCGTAGVLKERQRPVDAEEVELSCYDCHHNFHVYAVKGRWSGRFTCPNCGTENQVPMAQAESEEEAEATQPTAGAQGGSAPP